MCLSWSFRWEYQIFVFQINAIHVNEKSRCIKIVNGKQSEDAHIDTQTSIQSHRWLNMSNGLACVSYYIHTSTYV